MTQAPHTPVVTVKPQANIYSVMLLVAVVALAMTIGVCLWKLLAPMPAGYGLELKQLFDTLKDLR